ncbi:hypothetical protein NX722_27235 [Endozoicomonas gorgoniicola]|uniref:Uncharacterized protein n=1 Tax=Endozoicomonas gorgoniicola TaxID=1234144 RepID=A0ABT3N3Q0_9GAMM|nr:hypothetical protein [Endozoicomonas gorgoniicola]MCW7556257.1 hypothetical protein [Endozoicomonas gorgoniicola]
MTFKKIILSYIFVLLVSPLAVAGQKYAYLLYSENASASMVLVKVIENDRHETLASVAVEFSKDKAFNGYAGNIADTKKDHPELEFPGMAEKLTGRMMAVQSGLKQEAALKAPDSEFSMVMAVAGYETIHGTHPVRFPPQKTREREEKAKINIISVFADNGLTITKESIYGYGDRDFVLQLASEIDHKPHLTLFKATYDILLLTKPFSFEPVSKWESVHKYPFTNDSYQRKNKNLPSGSSFGLGFIVGDRFYSKRAVSKTPAPCFGNECSRKERERAEAAEFRKDMKDSFPNMTDEEIIGRYQGFKRNNELGDNTLNLYKNKQGASWLHAVDNILIIDGAKQLVRAITHQLPVLKKLLHEFQSDDKASDIIDIHVIGSHEDIYESVPALNAFVASEGKIYNFQLKRVPEDTLKQRTADALVHLIERPAKP